MVLLLGSFDKIEKKTVLEQKKNNCLSKIGRDLDTISDENLLILCINRFSFVF